MSTNSGQPQPETTDAASLLACLSVPRFHFVLSPFGAINATFPNEPSFWEESISSTPRPFLNQAFQSQSHLRGIVFSITSFTLWVVVDAMMKLLAEAHLPPYEIIGITGAIGALAMIAGMQPIAAIKDLWPKRVDLQMIPALLGLASNYFMVIALKHLPLTMFYVSVFTAPMVIAILAAAFLTEPLHWLRFLAIIIGFGGVIVISGPKSREIGITRM